MRKGLFGFLLLVLAAPLWADSVVTGAGGTFPQPLLEAWIRDFDRRLPVRVDYQSVGSAEGIRRITARSVDFAVTDIGLTESELSHDDLLQFPIVASGVVPVVHLSEAGGGLRLTGAVLAEIYLGVIGSWDDLKIQALNPGRTLPHRPITVIHRQEGSGSTFTFTHYLSGVSERFDRQLGVGSRLTWPVGVAALGNEGVAEKVRDTEGSIGYVEYVYARQFGLTMVDLLNRAGRYVAPNLESFAAAAAQARWRRPSYYEVLTDPEGAESWPVVAVSYVLLHKTLLDAEAAGHTLEFLDWVFKNGDALARENGYLLTGGEPLAGRIEASWKLLKDRQGRPVLEGGR